jgi:hypothetical protein
MRTYDQPALGWTTVLLRQPARIVEGRPEGGSDVFELICCNCGDHPDLDYRDVSPELQRIRGHIPSRRASQHTTSTSSSTMSGSPIRKSPQMWVKIRETGTAAPGARWSEGHAAGLQPKAHDSERNLP